MAFQIITDMEQADKLWAAGILYFWDEDGWELDTTNESYGGLYDWRPSADVDREGQQRDYAILLEE